MKRLRLGLFLPHLFTLGIFSQLLTACSYLVVSPPSQMMIAELPQVADSGEVVLQTEGDGTLTYGPILTLVNIRAARGFSKQREWNVQISGGRILKQEPGHLSGLYSENPEPAFAALSTDYKTEFFQNDWMVASAWGGGGMLISQAGKIVSPYFGAAVGKVNSWSCPFIAVNGWFAKPFETKIIWGGDKGFGGATSREPESKRLTNTLGIRAQLGTKLQISELLDFSYAVAYGFAKSKTDQLYFIQMGLGLRFHINKPTSTVQGSSPRAAWEVW